MSLKNLSIRFKLLGGYALIFILSTLAGGIVIYYTVQSSIEASIEQELTNSTTTILNMFRTAASTSIKTHLQAVAEKNKEIIQRFYSDYERGLISEDAAKELSRKIILSQTIGKTGYVFISTTGGNNIDHPNPGVSGKNFIDHDFVKKMMRMKEGYLEYDWKNPDEDHKRPKAMYMSYFEPWGWIISASSYREEFSELIRISDFKDNILRLRFGKTGYAFIVDSKGNMIVHPFLSGNHYRSKDKNGNYFVKEICQLKNGKILFSWKNLQDKNVRKKMVIFNYIPEYDWIVASVIYLDEIYAPLNTIRQIIIITIFLIVVLTILTSFWINNTLIRSLRGFMNRLTVASAGNFTTRMPLKSSDEIGQLAGYFNDFMNMLEKYSTSLKSEINQHEKTENALKISEAKYRTILERMEEGYFEVSFSGRFIFINRSMGKTIGVIEKSFLDNKIYDYMNQENSKKLTALFNKVKNSGIAVQISDLEFIKHNGSKCSIETSVSLLYDSHGNPVGFSGVLRDVTKRKKAEKALKLSEELFSKAFRNSPGGMFIAAINGIRIINVNDSFLKITGHSLLELIGKELTNIRFFQNTSDGIKLVKNAGSKKHLESLEFKFLTATGEKRIGVISAEIVNVWGEQCILAALEDITESRQLEAQILNVSEKERQKIAMTLHDDLCPHLIGIDVLIKMLRQRLEKKDIHEAQSVDKIRTLLLDSVDKTRQLSKGLFPVNLSEHGFDISLEELAAYVRDVFKISCELTFNISMPFKDSSLVVHLYYIVHEAVHNVAKHAGATQIQIKLWENDETIFFTIKDNGIGISTQKATLGMGLKIMKYRAARIGAFLDISKDSESGGTLVLIKFEKEGN